MKTGAPHRRLLAVRGGALGDFILTLPALQALADRSEVLELLTHPAYGSLARFFGIGIASRDLGAAAAAPLLQSGGVPDPEWAAWLGSFDEVFSWLPDADGSFRQQCLRYGVREFHQGDWRCIADRPAGRQLAAILPGPEPDPTVRLPPSAGPLPVPGSPPVIAVHPGSGSLRKNWPLRYWITLVQRCHAAAPGISWRIITGEAEHARLTEIHAACNDAGIPWEPWHDLPLPALATALRTCHAFFGHDSGISHLAAACGVPCHLLFGPTSPRIWAPQGGHVRILEAGPGGLTALKPDEAWTFIQSAVAKDRSGRDNDPVDVLTLFGLIEHGGDFEGKIA